MVSIWKEVAFPITSTMGVCLLPSHRAPEASSIACFSEAVVT